MNSGFDYSQLNPGIRRTVRLIHDLGYETCDSGDGETREHACDRDEGYVVIVVRDHEDMEVVATDVYEALREHIPDDGFGGWNGVHIQAHYSPVDGLRMVDINGINDSMLKDSSIGGHGDG